MKNLLYIILAVVFCSVFIWSLFPKIDDNDAIDAIVGEASNQSDDTMVCVAQALHHRGTLKGVYGFHAKHNIYEDADVWDRAEDAWEQSPWLPDKVKGTKNWGTMDDLVKLRQLGYKVKCGDLYFY